MILRNKNNSPERKRRVKPVTYVPGCCFLALVYATYSDFTRFLRIERCCRQETPAIQ